MSPLICDKRPLGQRKRDAAEQSGKNGSFRNRENLYYQKNAATRRYLHYLLSFIPYSVSINGFLLENHNEPRHKISNNVVCATSKYSDQPAHTRSLIIVHGYMYTLGIFILRKQTTMITLIVIP